MNKIVTFLFVLLALAIGLTLFLNNPSKEPKPLVVVLLGPPGAGKSALAEGLQTKRGIPHISTGDLLREHRRMRTPLGEAAQEYMDKGLLVPDDLVLGMLRERLEEPDCQHGYLLDGFPRTLAQAEALDQLVNHGENLVVVNLQASDATVTGRILGRASKMKNPRHDDQPEIIKTRLQAFRKEIKPLMDYYQERGVLHHINNERTLEISMAEFFSIIDATEKR